MKLYKGKYFEGVFEDWRQEFIGSCIVLGHKEFLSEMTSEEWIELGLIEKEYAKKYLIQLCLILLVL